VTRLDLALHELAKAAARGENPSASRVWTRAPWGLRRRFADGYITADEFYDALRRWLEFEKEHS
jgi:hypothetical protein